MKKNVYLLLSYFRSAGLSVLAVIVISAFAMTGLTVSYGRIKAETEKYDKLRASGLSDCYYGTKFKPDADLEEMIMASDGVAEVINRPITVGFIPQNGQQNELFSLMLYSEKLYESAALNLIGPGFDYGSDEPECIIAGDYFKEYAVGDTFSVQIPTKQKEEFLSVDFRVKGIVRLPQSILTMSGGGSSIDASSLYENLTVILVKDTDAFKTFLGDNIRKSLAIATFFIRLDSDLTTEKRNETVNELSKYLNLQSVKGIIDQTKAQVRENVSDFLPVIMFCVLYSLLTLVGMEVLISFKTSEDAAVCLCVGMSRAKLTGIVCAAELLTISLSFALCCILNRLVFRIPAVSAGIVYYPGLLLPALILGVFEIMTAFLIAVFGNKKSIKRMQERT